MEKVAPRENFKIKILRSLVKGPKTFTELQKELDAKSPTGVADALTQLEDKNFIIRVRKDQRRYHITMQGRLALQNDQLLRQISSGGNPGYVERTQSFPQENLKVENIKTVFEEQGFGFPFEISLVGDSDINFQKLVDEVSLTLSYLPGVLTAGFAKEIGRHRGLQPLSSLTDSGLPDKFFSNYLGWIKKAYDYEITLSLHFNPRQTVNSIGWTKAIKKANEIDEELARVKQDRQEAYRNMEDALKMVIDANLEAAAGGITFFLESPSFSPLNPGSNMATSEEALLNKITDRILQDPHIEGRATKEEIRTILNAKMKEGCIKMTSKTIYGIEKAHACDNHETPSES